MYLKTEDGEYINCDKIDKFYIESDYPVGTDYHTENDSPNRMIMAVQYERTANLKLTTPIGEVNCEKIARNILEHSILPSLNSRNEEFIDFPEIKQGFSEWWDL